MRIGRRSKRDHQRENKDKFFELLPSFQWASARAEMSVLAMKDFEAFVELLQTTGGKEVPKESSFETEAKA